MAEYKITCVCDITHVWYDTRVIWHVYVWCGMCDVCVWYDVCTNDISTVGWKERTGTKQPFPWFQQGATLGGVCGGQRRHGEVPLAWVSGFAILLGVRWLNSACACWNARLLLILCKHNWVPRPRPMAYFWFHSLVRFGLIVSLGNNMRKLRCFTPSDLISLDAFQVWCINHT